MPVCILSYDRLLSTVKSLILNFVFISQNYKGTLTRKMATIQLQNVDDLDVKKLLVHVNKNKRILLNFNT
jgi:hypothetical protein